MAPRWTHPLIPQTQTPPKGAEEPMPELIHKIKKDGHELKRSVPSRLRWQPVDTSMFTAMGMERDDLGTVELFRAGGLRGRSWRAETSST